MAAGVKSIRIVGDVSDFIEVVKARYIEFEAALDRFIARQFPVVSTTRNRALPLIMRA